MTHRVIVSEAYRARRERRLDAVERWSYGITMMFGALGLLLLWPFVLIYRAVKALMARHSEES